VLGFGHFVDFVAESFDGGIGRGLLIVEDWIAKKVHEISL
jgi:hypothetical protein